MKSVAGSHASATKVKLVAESHAPVAGGKSVTGSRVSSKRSTIRSHASSKQSTIRSHVSSKQSVSSKALSKIEAEEEHAKEQAAIDK